jgi:hypothetical protein
MMNRRIAIGLLAWALIAQPAPSHAAASGETRFFAECPRRGPISLHHDANPWDPHAILYTVMGASEVEILRLADALIDLPLPGPRLQPFRRLTNGIQAGFHRLPPWRLTQRVGEFVDALQLPELSLGDASATYTVATGGTTGPGSGTIIRIHKLIDWTQHVTGDLNRLMGRPVGRRSGLITWSLPERGVDGLQQFVLVSFQHASVLVAQVLEGSLTGIELVAEQAVNVGHREAHAQQTVFLRMPVDVYRANELWMLEHRRHLVVTSVAELQHATHAELAHRRRPMALGEWSPIDVPGRKPDEVVILTTTRVMSRAPAALRPYVIPAAWLLPDAQDQENSEFGVRNSE